MFFNGYRSMWVMVLFDLPTETREDRQRHTKFRKNLEKSGFSRFQLSIYIRFCPSRENADVHIRRVRSFLPPYGHVIIFTITDKQFGQIEVFHNAESISVPESPQQLQLF
jgi:CRISPR-associated protein Cas2